MAKASACNPWRSLDAGVQVLISDAVQPRMVRHESESIFNDKQRGGEGVDRQLRGVSGSLGQAADGGSNLIARKIPNFNQRLAHYQLG